MMMESAILEEANIIKDVSPLKLEKIKKESIDTTTKGIRSIFRLKRN